ncbi:Lethal(2) giant larvae protein 2 [Thelohanellus kitauei]|uniref:Lethal(2) giant larvae protein 2 n=1 Tax=Thelohanellus kitauei TaxID=669202 RepID=A0A0C2J1Y1_THEKT|nr:Lethal(2) giant larvae protein 2 [Thelohanellus kitauei]
MKENSTRYVSGKKIEASMRGIVRSMAFVECPMQNTPNIKSMFIAGTNYGRLYILTLRFQTYERHMYIKAVDSTKEVQMNHKAPIINLKLIGLEYPSIFLSPFNECSNKITPFDHYLLCCTEEQIKLINLFNLKTKMKLNLTSTQGIRIKKLFIFNKNEGDPSKYSHYLVGYSCFGSVMVIGLNKLKTLRSFPFLNKEDILPINTISMTQDGCGILQNTSSELMLFTIKSSNVRSIPDQTEPQAQHK